jgi:transketolase
MQYYVNGMIFDTEEGALKYEKELREAEEKESEKKKEKEKEYQELIDAYDRYVKLATDYDKKYKENVYTLNELFKDLLSI